MLSGAMEIGIVCQILSLLIAVILHEIAHGYVAKKLGDPTASDAGRLTLNPLKHIDLFWTILLPGMLILSHSPVVFGGAKPVPVDPRYFKRPRRDMMWVALAGPMTNIILALLSILMIWVCGASISSNGGDNSIFPIFVNTVVLFLVNSVFINVILAVFNLVPVPPLDGSRILSGLLPWKYARQMARLERYGILLIFVLLYFRVLDYVFNPILQGVEILLRELVGY